MLLARNEAELRLRGSALELLHELVHAMGQPLTALQLFRVMAVTGVMDAEMVGDVAGQVESATEMYRALRMLIEAADQAPEVTNAGTIVERFAEEWGRRAARQGARCAWRVRRASIEWWAVRAWSRGWIGSLRRCWSVRRRGSRCLQPGRRW